MNAFIESIGTTIKKERIKVGYTQETIAQISGVDRAQLSRIESGEVSGVTYATIEKILHALGKTLVVESLDELKFDIHPFVKWAGGKTQLLEIIKKNMPSKYKRYYEPFVGGGALLFEIQPKRFSINDMNRELITAFNCFKDENEFKELINEIEIHTTKHSEEYYYEVREMDRDKEFESLPNFKIAARMIYLNKACFNGLYRVNASGYFNVPSGKKDVVNCYDLDNFMGIREFISSREARITCLDFEEAVKNAKKGDFVYFDPPYDVIEGKNSFTSYGKDEFGKNEQIRLRDCFAKLTKKGVKVMLSNHNTEFIRELYKEYNIIVVEARRNINSKASGRGKIEEVLITNYPTDGE